MPAVLKDLGGSQKSEKDFKMIYFGFQTLESQLYGEIAEALEEVLFLGLLLMKGFFLTKQSCADQAIAISCSCGLQSISNGDMTLLRGGELEFSSWRSRRPEIDQLACAISALHVVLKHCKSHASIRTGHAYATLFHLADLQRRCARIPDCTCVIALL